MGVDHIVFETDLVPPTSLFDEDARSVKEECLSRVTLFGERTLWHALRHYTHHYHQVRNHQEKGKVLLLPTATYSQTRDHPMQCRERLGGLLKYDYREAT